MSQLTNAIVKLNPQRLNFPLATFHARQLHSFTARFVGAPEDCADIICRVFRTNGDFSDVPCDISPDGNLAAYIVGALFPDAGQSRYQIHAYDAFGNATALGEGKIDIEPFTATGEQVDPGTERTLTMIPDRDGNLHPLLAVADDDGNWTTIIGTEG